MQRRRFLIGSGIALGGALGTAGCFGSATGSPPRESKVFRNIDVSADGTTVELEEQPMVQSRRDMSTNIGHPSTGGLAAVSPIGVARGQEEEQTSNDPRGRGRADAAPRGRNGRSKWRGGDYQEWWDEHGDGVDEYSATVTSAGFFYYGSTETFRSRLPGPAPLEWDLSINAVQEQTISWSVDPVEGWYRVGARLERGEIDLGWEAIDYEVRRSDAETSAPENETAGQVSEPTYEIVSQWKVSPNL
jgi:hypothetical protein